MYGDNSKRETHPVGQKKPNAWGLYDMHGNVWEWCGDWYEDYPESFVTDSEGPDHGKFRVLRGGAWINDPRLLRCAGRAICQPGNGDDYAGFRVVRVSPAQ